MLACSTLTLHDCWQMLPWRCSVCCMGFPSKLDLLRHFNMQEHCHLAKLALQHVFGTLRTLPLFVLNAGV